MKSKSILVKFLLVLAPIYLVLVLIGSFLAAQILIRDNTDLLAARVGSLAARVSLALDIHEAYAYNALAQDLIAPLGVDQAVVCVEFKSVEDNNVVAAHPPTIGCAGQENAPFEAEIPVDDYNEYSLYIKFSDHAITEAVTKQISMTVAVLIFAFVVTLISAAIGFKTIVSARLLALHDAIRMAANSMERKRVRTSGYDELAEIINAYNTLMDQDAVRERQLTAANEILSRQSKQDHLTGLYNRRYFSSMTKEHKPVSTFNSDNSTGAFMLMDIDHFKRINDTHGHGAGDDVLVELSSRITDCLPDDTPVVRWGGEEILVYLDGIADSEVNTYATMLLNVIGAKPVQIKTGEICVTTSIGIVRLPFTCDKQPLSPEDAVNLADAALYKAKEGGRNRAVGIVDQSLASQQNKTVVESNFDQAINDGLIHVETIMGPLQLSENQPALPDLGTATPRAA